MTSCSECACYHKYRNLSTNDLNIEKYIECKFSTTNIDIKNFLNIVQPYFLKCHDGARGPPPPLQLCHSALLPQIIAIVLFTFCLFRDCLTLITPRRVSHFHVRKTPPLGLGPRPPAEHPHQSLCQEDPPPPPRVTASLYYEFSTALSCLAAT